MISPWDIYWVMQLDAIVSALSALAGGGIAIGLVLTVWNGISRFDTNEYPSLCDPEKRAAAWGARGKVRTQVLLFAVPLFALSAFIPSSKTAAAMFVIPAIANNEAIQREAGDLYQIAKDGLRELVKPDESVKAEKVEK